MAGDLDVLEIRLLAPRVGKHGHKSRLPELGRSIIGGDIVPFLSRHSAAKFIAREKIHMIAQFGDRDGGGG